jgi:NADPH:quinone reductase-like Zn-dependent oxidoreductase
LTLESYICLKPAQLSHIDACSIPVAFATAWILLYEMGGLRGNQTLLIQNAGGSVGLAALDIARHLGAKTIGTASSGKHEFLLSRGLDHVIDYRNRDITDQVLELTDGKGCDLIVDPIGDAEWAKNFKLLRKTGRLGVFGASSLQSNLSSSGIFGKIYALLVMLWRLPRWSPLTLMDENKGVFGVNLGHMWDEEEKIGVYLKMLVNAAVGEEKWVRPCVDAVFSFQDVSKAHDYIEQRRNMGKVILVPNQADADEWNENYKRKP